MRLQALDLLRRHPMRAIHIDRPEAEWIVEEAERSGARQWQELAAYVRKVFGMGPSPFGIDPGDFQQKLADNEPRDRG